MDVIRGSRQGNEFDKENTSQTGRPVHGAEMDQGLRKDQVTDWKQKCSKMTPISKALNVKCASLYYLAEDWNIIVVK